jgi:hypothetical protein
MKKFLSVLVVAAIAASASVLACGEGAKIACPFGKVDGVEKAVNNLDNGVKIAWATKDAEMVKQLQTSVAAECEGKCEGCSKGVMTATDVERKIENTDTGVVVILTSSNPEMVKKVQAFGASQKGDCKGKCPMSKHGKKA